MSQTKSVVRAIVKSKVARVLGASAEALSSAAVRERLGEHSAPMISAALSQLYDEGVVLRVGNGPHRKYRLSGHGRREYPMATAPSLIDDTTRKRIQSSSEHT